MASELQKVRAGFYRHGAYCIHKAYRSWGVYHGPQFKQCFDTLKQAAAWCSKYAAHGAA